MSSDVLLQKLNDIQLKSIAVSVPSLNKQIHFKPLNIKQQKEIIKSSFDKNIPGISFNTTINNIISNNADSNNEEFLVVDRPLIALHLRKNIFGSKIKHTVENIDEENKSSESSIQLDIESILVNEPYVFDENLKSIILNIEELEIQLNVPTLKTDNKVNKEAQKTLSHLLDQPNGIKDMISELFVYELVKFINYVEVKNVTKAIFNDLSVAQQIQILESLPASINKQIMNYVEKIREFERKFTTFVKDDKEYNILIDAAFFNSE